MDQVTGGMNQRARKCLPSSCLAAGPGPVSPSIAFIHSDLTATALPEYQRSEHRSLLIRRRTRVLGSPCSCHLSETPRNRESYHTGLLCGNNYTFLRPVPCVRKDPPHGCVATTWTWSPGCFTRAPRGPGRTDRIGVSLRSLCYGNAL